MQIRVVEMTRDRRTNKIRDFQKTKGFARRFPKGEWKALWRGDGAKPHILEMLRLLYLEMFGLSLTAPFCEKMENNKKTLPNGREERLR